MNVQKMMDILGRRCEDEDESRFSAALKLDALDIAQHTLTNLIHNAYLTELEVKEFTKECAIASDDDEASFAVNSLASEMLRGGLLHVRFNSKYCKIIEYKDLKKTENQYDAGDDNSPIAYLYRNRIYVQATDTTPEVDIWYLKKPKALANVYVTDSVASGATDGSYGYSIQVTEAGLSSAVNDYYNGSVVYNKTRDFYAIVYDYVGGTTVLHVLYDQAETAEWQATDEFYFVSGSGTVENLGGDTECELNESLHELVIDLAESQMWRMDAKSSRAEAVEKKAMNEIAVLNARYLTEAPKGVGSRQNAA